jgi:hypothetical protein
MSITAKKLLLTTSILVSLLGCATNPIPTNSAQDVPNTRVLNAALLEKKDGLGQVIVKRDNGIAGYGCHYIVFANGAPVAEVATGERIVFYLPEGEHMLAAKATGLCISGLSEAKAIVRRDLPVIFRISYGSQGEFSLQQTAF